MHTQSSFDYYCETKHFKWIIFLYEKIGATSNKQQMTWSYRYRCIGVGNYIGRCAWNTCPDVQGMCKSKILHTSNAGNV